MSYRVAFIGMGAIGQDVWRELKPLFAEIKAETLVLRRQQGGTTIADLLAFEPQLVIETASQEAVKSYIPECLRTGATVVITSVGALADASFYAQLQQLAKQHNARIVVPSGAIGALDYIKAVRHAPDLKVIYESRKPVAAWLPELQALGIAPDSIQDELLLFEGSANEAALRYPQNLNVAATLALAGAGMEATQVQVIVDPTLNQNKHSIYVSSQFGEMKMEISNTPSPFNPKSSWVVAQSVRSVVRRHFAPLQIG